jgi:hypothetical protein
LPSGWMTSGDQCVTQPQCLRRKGAQGAVALDVSASAALGQDELDHRQAAQQARRGAGTANSCGWGAARARVECRYSACRSDSYRTTWQILVPAQRVRGNPACPRGLPKALQSRRKAQQ